MTRPAADSEVYAEPREGAATAPAALLAMSVSIAVSVGRARATVEELLALGPNSILELDARIEDPVELIIGERVVARGRLVESTDGAGVCVEVTELLDG